MVAGQVIDLMSEGRQVTLEQLKEMDEKKTGALIWAAVQIGCEIAGAPTQYREAAGLYARNVGLAFQIVDDILDQTADAAQLGKPIGSDAANDKATYVSLLGLERCQELAQQLTAGAVKALDVFDGDTSFLRSLAQSLAQRKK